MNWYKVEWNDHEFAAFLRKHGAINTWDSTQRTTTWYKPASPPTKTKFGQPVAAIVYHDKDMGTTKYINEELKDDRTPGHE